MFFKITIRNRLYSHKRLYQQSGTNSSWGPYYCCAKHCKIACFLTFMFNLCYLRTVILREVEKDILLMYFSKHNCVKEVK